MREVAQWVLKTPKWLNATLDEELHMEACVTITGIAVVLLQRHPERTRDWELVATWVHCLEALEQSGSASSSS